MAEDRHGRSHRISRTRRSALLRSDALEVDVPPGALNVTAEQANPRVSRDCDRDSTGIPCPAKHQSESLSHEALRIALAIARTASQCPRRSPPLTASSRIHFPAAPNQR